jgi:serine/threonine-protein kinase
VPSSGGSTQKKIAIGVGVLGVVGVGLGTVFGLSAISKNGDSNADGRCVGNVCDDRGLDLRDSARTSGSLSTVAFIAGGACLAGAAVLWFTAPAGARVQASPTAQNGGAGVALRTTF